MSRSRSSMTRSHRACVAVFLLATPSVWSRQAVQRTAVDYMFYDGARGQVVMIGKAADATGMWAWDGQSWLAIEERARHRAELAAVAYAGRKRLVMHGGNGPHRQQFSGVWLWDGLLWTQEAGASPGQRRRLGRAVCAS